MSTHDLVTFERRVDVNEIPNNESIVFVLRNHGKIKNSKCKNKVSKRLKKLKV
jgi:hypothetical protein